MDTDLRTPDARRTIVLWSVLAAIVVVGSYLPIEAMYRAYMYYKYVVLTDFQGVAITDAKLAGAMKNDGQNIYGGYPPSTDFHLTHYDGQNEPLNRHLVHTNNLGWISRNDFQVSKSGDEFRIAVVGASLTASSTNEFVWPDELQNILNRDTDLLSTLGVARISVLNLGRAGAPIEMILKPGMESAQRFSPDYVVFGFSTPLLDQFSPKAAREALAPPKPKAAAEKKAGLVPNAAPGYETQPPDIVVDGVETWLYCSGPPLSLSNPRCRVSPNWYAPPGREIGRDDFAKIKRDLAHHIMLHRVLLNWRPLALLDVLGHPIIGQEAAGASRTEGESERPEATDKIRTLVEILERAKAMQPNLLITHDPLMWDPRDLKGPPLLDALVPAARGKGLDFVRMAEYLPLQVGETQWSKWYLADGHWSDEGARVFATGLARALRPRLIAARGGPLIDEAAACEPAYAAYREGQDLRDRGDGQAALKSFASAFGKVPAHLRQGDQGASAFADLPYALCGFVPDLSLQRVLLQEEAGEPVSPDELQAALRLAPDRGVYFAKKAARRTQIGDHGAAAEALSELIRLDPGRIDLYQARASQLLAANDYAPALRDIEVVLKARPEDVVALFTRAMLRSLAGDPRGTIADADRLVKSRPKDAASIYLRLDAELTLGDIDRAARDLEVLEKVAADHPFLPTLRVRLERLRAEIAAGASTTANQGG